MYQPPQFRSDDPAIAAELMRRHSFATLVSTDDQGFPFVTHLPLHLEERESRFVLHGHVARPNPHWRHLQAWPQGLALFMGPHAYQSPRIYPDAQRVPSWNYLAVQCKVRARLVDSVEAKDALLKKLIADHEPAYAAQWQSLPEDYTRKMLAGIMGLELEVLEWTCKLKVNQHRPESHVRMRELYAAGNADERELAGWMQRFGLGGA
jgi:transcriptional regulator